MKGTKRKNKVFFVKLCVLLINKSHWKLGESMHAKVITIIIRRISSYACRLCCSKISFNQKFVNGN